LESTGIAKLEHAQLNNGGVNPTGYATHGLMNDNSQIFGVMNGTGSTVAVPVLGTGVVVIGNMAKQSVAGNQTALMGNIVDNSVTSVQLLNNGGSASSAFVAQAAVDPAYNISIPSKSLIGTPSSTNYNLTTSGVNIAPGDVLAVNSTSGGIVGNQTGWVTIRKALLTLAEPTSQTYPQIPFVAANSTAYSLGTLQGANSGNPVGRILQQQVTILSALTSAVSHVSTASLPNYNATGMTPMKTVGAATSFTFTPLSASSTLYIEMFISTGMATGIDYAFVGLYDGTGAVAPLAYGVSRIETGVVQPIIGLGSFAPGSTSLITFYPAFGSPNNTAYINSVDGSTVVFGAIQSWIKITEYI
jgi:hypothetical protein